MAENVKHILIPGQQLDLQELLERISLHREIQQGGIFIIAVDSEETREAIEQELKQKLNPIQWCQLDLHTNNDPLVTIVAEENPPGSKIWSLSFLPTLPRREYRTVWQALNFRREYIIQEKLILIIWVFDEQIADIQKLAKDFWSFRTAVYSFSARKLPPPTVAAESRSRIRKKITDIKKLLTRVERKSRKDYALMANLYFRLGGLYYRQFDFPAALQAYEKARQLFQKLKNERRFYATEGLIGNIHHAIGELDAALACFERALAGYRKSGDLVGEALQLLNIGNVHYTQGDYDTALEYLEQSLTIQRKIGDVAGMGTTLNSIGQIYGAKGDYDTALEYLEQSLDITKKIGDLAGEGTTLNNISRIYDARGDYDTALAYLQQSLDINKKIGDLAGQIPTLHNMASILWERKNSKAALKTEYNAYQLALQIKDAMGLFNVGKTLGTWLIQIGEKDEGRAMLQQAYQIGSAAGLPGTEEIQKMLEF